LIVLLIDDDDDGKDLVFFPSLGFRLDNRKGIQPVKACCSNASLI